MRRYFFAVMITLSALIFVSAEAGPSQTEVYYQHSHGLDPMESASEKVFAKHSGDQSMGYGCDTDYQLRGMYLEQRKRPERERLRGQDADSRFEVRHLTLNCLVGEWEVITGKQQVTWGEADFFRIIDVVNPLDLRENILAYIDDFEEGRVPLTMLNATRMLENGDVQLLIIPEVKAARLPSADSEFDPLAGIDPRPATKTPDSYQAESLSAGVRHRFVAGDDWDVGLYGYYGWEGTPQITMGSDDMPALRLFRKKLIGMSLATPIASWIARMDIAWAPSSTIMTEEGLRGQTDKVSSLVGFDYSYASFSTNIQFAQQRLFGGDADNTVSSTLSEASLTLTKRLIADRLSLSNNTLAGSENGYTGYLNQLSIGYRLTPLIRLDTAVIHYFGHKQSQFGQFEDNSRLSFKLSAMF